MKDTLISFQTAQLAKGKGFDEVTVQNYDLYNPNQNPQLLKNYNAFSNTTGKGRIISAPTQSLLQKWIRENRGVHIEIHRNASGYYWSMCKSNGGTDLGYANMIGPNPGGTWDSHEEALEDALQVQLCFDLPEDVAVIKHWSNYVNRAVAMRNNAKSESFCL